MVYPNQTKTTLPNADSLLNAKKKMLTQKKKTTKSPLNAKAPSPALCYFSFEKENAHSKGDKKNEIRQPTKLTRPHPSTSYKLSYAVLKTRT